MNLKQIERDFRVREKTFDIVTNRQCKQRVFDLIGLLAPRFKITEIKIGMGVWVVNGSDFFVKEDKKIRMLPLSGIFDWLTEHRIPLVKGLSKKHVALFLELQDLLDFWMEKTGGEDISTIG